MQGVMLFWYIDMGMSMGLVRRLVRFMMRGTLPVLTVRQFRNVRIVDGRLLKNQEIVGIAGLRRVIRFGKLQNTADYLALTT